MTCESVVLGRLVVAFGASKVTLERKMGRCFKCSILELSWVWCDIFLTTWSILIHLHSIFAHASLAMCTYSLPCCWVVAFVTFCESVVLGRLVVAFGTMVVTVKEQKSKIYLTLLKQLNALYYKQNFCGVFMRKNILSFFSFFFFPMPKSWNVCDN